jgi:hypothetical protein
MQIKLFPHGDKRNSLYLKNNIYLHEYYRFIAMKSLLYFTISFLLIISIISCGKENDADKNNIDSIPLFYQKLDSNTTSITLPDNTTIYYSTHTVTFYAGPHPYERTNIEIMTSDTNMRVSCGKNYYYPDLDVDSLINNNIYWMFSVYISYNFTINDYISVNPKYIGLRRSNGNQRNYGWIQCNKGMFVDYAIDTSSTNIGDVKAGRKYKYFPKL